MTRINNLNTPNIPRLESRVRKVENGAPMNNAGVGRSGFEVYDGGNINISNGSISINGSLTGGGTFGWTGSFTQAGPTIITGSLDVTGPTTLDGVTDIGGNTKITGTLDVTGVTKLAGNTTISGELDVTGKTDLGGDTTISGTLDVTGNMATKGTLSVEGSTTLKNDLNVTTGKINVGQLQIEPAGGGQLNFTDGAISRSSTFGMLVNDGIAVELAAPTVKLNGTAVIVSGLPTTTQPANLYVDGSGRLFRSTAV